MAGIMRMVRPRMLLALLLLLAVGCDGEPGAAPATTAPGEEATDDPGTGGATEPDRPTDELEDGEPPGEEPTDEAPTDEPPLPLADVSLTLTPVADADQPTAGAVSPEGVLYIAERAGLVRPLTSEGLGEAVLDLSGETTTDSERGLLGIAFDGEHLYVSFTDRGGDSRVESFAWDDQAVDEGTRRTLLEVDQPAGNHNGGDITIGPDGMLWLGLGDGGGADDAFDTGQDPASPLATLLRLDPQTGEAPGDNPFAGDLNADPRVWAYGLRNPWRFSFDRESGDLWIADVGQRAREEVNHVPAGQGAGANFGWSLMEGTLEFAGSAPADHWPPVYEYPTSDGCAITGGYVYRGSAVGGLTGAYLFSDYCAGGLQALRAQEGEVVDVVEFDVGGAGSVVSFAQDADGEIYVLTFGDGILRIDPA